MRLEKGALLIKMEYNAAHTSRDRDYWNQYYAKGICPTEPSDFARYALTWMEPNRILVDLGCGNGRDALFFAQNHLNVIAVDLSDEAISTLHKHRSDTFTPMLDDFVQSSIHRPDSYDYAYSRFTLHAIDEAQGSELIRNVFYGLKVNGRFFIEVRGTHDPLFGLGQQIGKNTFIYNGHSRRFLVLEELIGTLTAVGFTIEYAAEQSGFAAYHDDDPPVIRVVAAKLTAR